MKYILSSLLIVTLFTGCLKGDSASSCNYDACAKVAPQSEVTAVEGYLTANGITATKLCSGMYYRIETQGTGPNPDICNNVTVNYQGSLTNGVVFDASNSSAPPTFPLSGLITGWKNGLPLLKQGGRIWLYIPPSLGYGSTAQGSIPANSVLIFRIDLVAVL